MVVAAVVFNKRAKAQRLLQEQLHTDGVISCETCRCLTSRPANQTGCVDVTA